MKTKRSTRSIFANARYFGKHILVVKGQVYAVKSAKEASKLFDKLVAKGTVPTVTFVPKNQPLILSWK